MNNKYLLPIKDYEKKGKKNPKVLIGIAIAFIGSGIALGIVFLVIGMKNKKDQEKNNSEDRTSAENS